MIKQIAPTNLTPEADKLKNELVQETLQSLRMNKDNRFDLSTEEGIHQVVDYLVDFHVQQKIANGEILIFKPRQTTSINNGGDV
ncbi:hypothetical protein ABTM70_01245 [Acinetobacter baumannii]